MIAGRIETARLVLTPLAVADAEEMVGVLSDAALYSFTGGRPPSYEELVARYEAQVAGSGRDDEVWLNWVARLKEDGAAVGFVQATVTDDRADMAWVIGTKWQGSGFATEAATAMKDRLGRDGIKLFGAHVHPDHTASQRVAAAIGLRATGQLDEDGEEVWESNPVTSWAMHWPRSMSSSIAASTYSGGMVSKPFGTDSLLSKIRSTLPAGPDTF